MNLQPLLESAISAAKAASLEILEVYNSGDFQEEAKADNSPLTLADQKAHIAISSILKSSNLPILSEEGKNIPYAERKDWEYFWMIDPLDGTKEFLKKNGEFTVNIALINENRPVLGVVAVPVTGDIYYASPDAGAFVIKNDEVISLEKRHAVLLSTAGLRLVASRSHMNDETRQFMDKLNAPALVSKGSSLKFMLLAEGKADIYPRYAPTMEWDTAAAHAIINAVGLKVYRAETRDELVYNKKELLNPSFLAI